MKIRVQLDFREDEVLVLDALRDRCLLKSRAAAVRVALGLMEWVAVESDSGKQIVAVDGKAVHPLLVPGLTTAAPKELAEK